MAFDAESAYELDTYTVTPARTCSTSSHVQASLYKLLLLSQLDQLQHKDIATVAMHACSYTSKARSFVIISEIPAIELLKSLRFEGGLFGAMYSYSYIWLLRLYIVGL